MGTMFVVFIFGIYRYFTGTLPIYSQDAEGLVPIGQAQGLLSVAAMLLILKAFANGSASLTGLEAISDSVPLFKSPEHVNAKRVLTAASAQPVPRHPRYCDRRKLSGCPALTRHR